MGDVLSAVNMATDLLLELEANQLPSLESRDRFIAAANALKYPIQFDKSNFARETLFTARQWPQIERGSPSWHALGFRLVKHMASVSKTPPKKANYRLEENSQLGMLLAHENGYFPTSTLLISVAEHLIEETTPRAKKTGSGRPSKLSEEIRQEVYARWQEAKEAGTSKAMFCEEDDLCQLHGITPQKLDNQILSTIQKRSGK